MSTAGALLEQARTCHVEIEQLEAAIIHSLGRYHPRSIKEQVSHLQYIRYQLDRLTSTSNTLYEYYADTHGDKSRDLKSLGTYEDGDDAALFSVFYDSLKHLRDLHRSGAGVSASVVKVEKKTDFRDVEPKGFSGEEFSGKFVDLNILHLRFLNLPKESGAKVSKKRKRMSYLNYLKSFADFENLGLLKNNEYISYLKALLDYLADFHQRINPLYPVEKIHKTLEEEFEKITVDDERIKLFCLSCNKQFAKDTVYNAHLLGNKHLKNTKNYLEKKAVASNSTIPNDTVPLLEFKIYYFRELLQERILATIQFVESIQTKTYSEILSERTNEPDAEEESEHESDDEQAVYNPLKIPLGWDGKPIPYWLYKLHGLNIEYKCEICGDFSYWGPRAFDLHFNEWRHINGLKSLGIPNGSEFKNITLRQDAIALYQKLQYLDKRTMWRPENDEEFEDEEGNVFNKKTFDDLKRQGLL